MVPIDLRHSDERTLMSAQTGHDDAKPQTVLESLIRRWRQRPDWSESERQVVVADLMPEGDERRRYLARFVTLSVLSTVLASFGLISNSIALLIAGMLLDPLRLWALVECVNRKNDHGFVNGNGAGHGTAAYPNGNGAKSYSNGNSSSRYSHEPAS